MRERQDGGLYSTIRPLAASSSVTADLYEGDGGVKLRTMAQARCVLVAPQLAALAAEGTR